MVQGQGALEGVVCGAELRQPEALELHPGGAILIPQSEPCCWGSLGTESTIGQRRSESHFYRASN